MWSKISNALKSRDGNDADPEHSDAQSTTSRSQPDPFRADATTYYSHQSPTIPPPGSHSRTASREEDIILSLRTQLALQQETCAQFEIDLGARDQLVEALRIRLDASEKDNNKRRSALCSWRKKAADLERLCRHLEEEVDNSRRESMERSVMDEASGEALRQLHRLISQLEREKKEVEAERDSLVQTVENMNVETTKLREEVVTADGAGGEAERQLRHQISQLELEKVDVQAERDTLAHKLERAEAETAQLRGELSVTDEASAEALRRLQTEISRLEQEKSGVEVERDTLAQAREKEDNEALEAQDAEISRLRTHIQQLQKDSAAMEVTIVQLNKQLDQDKEDINGLNIALESKQQELELVKRKQGARVSVRPTPVRTNNLPSTVRTNNVPSTVGKPVRIHGKENTTTPMAPKQSRRTMVPA